MVDVGIPNAALGEVFVALEAYKIERAAPEEGVEQQAAYNSRKENAERRVRKAREAFYFVGAAEPFEGISPCVARAEYDRSHKREGEYCEQNVGNKSPACVKTGVDVEDEPAVAEAELNKLAGRIADE